ncbi:hypothetical protein [Sphingomonas sp. PAMC 26617]|jgi:hypothetical protein|uniref:hypothetical protein n=1 Tax=Sphingomonas sp. PAMC 26617 TaxID=1112216 RepID=UPI000288AB8C|nr:hypothetical protein [Sphingomonas sp. PAMC 26617]
MTVKPALHFVGFRGDEFLSAVRIWGMPDFIHPGWDRWAQQEIHPTDTVIFASGTETDPFARFNYPHRS